MTWEVPDAHSHNAYGVYARPCTLTFTEVRQIGYGLKVYMNHTRVRIQSVHSFVDQFATHLKVDALGRHHVTSASRHWEEVSKKDLPYELIVANDACAALTLLSMCTHIRNQVFLELGESQDDGRIVSIHVRQLESAKVATSARILELTTSIMQDLNPRSGHSHPKLILALATQHILHSLLLKDESFLEKIWRLTRPVQGQDIPDFGAALKVALSELDQEEIAAVAVWLCSFHISENQEMLKKVFHSVLTLLVARSTCVGLQNMLSFMRATMCLDRVGVEANGVHVYAALTGLIAEAARVCAENVGHTTGSQLTVSVVACADCQTFAVSVKTLHAGDDPREVGMAFEAGFARLCAERQTPNMSPLLRHCTITINVNDGAFTKELKGL